MDELVKVALVGTAKHPQGGRVASDMAGELLSNWQSEPAEGLLLLQAGAEAISAQAGYEAPLLQTAAEPSLPDAAPAGSPRLTGILQNALASDSKELLKEFADMMHSAGLLVPPELLPAVLDVQDLSLRESLVPILGERGRWLSQFRESWQWATQGAGALSSADLNALRRRWEEGNIAERAAALGRVRRVDAVASRSWLQDVIKSEKPENRVRLLKEFAIAIEAGDEPLLEEALTDRSDNVRRVAADLLARLPGSQLAARMRQRADAILQGDAAKPGKRPAIACTPPTEIDAAWKRDGVPEQAPGGRGKRAVWAAAVIRAVPLAHWTTRFASDPPALIGAVGEDPFARAVMEGWTQAASVTFPSEPESAAWLVPLWHYWLPLAATDLRTTAAEAKANLSALLALMPRAMAEACIDARLDASDEVTILMADMVELVPRPWSGGFAGRFLKHAQRLLDRPADNAAYRWLCALSPAAKALPPACFRDALQMAEQWLQSPKSGHYTEREIEKFMEIIRLRESFYQEVLP
jgi:hypothetical protein